MSCFKQLVESKFLSNVRQELHQARQALHQSSMVEDASSDHQDSQSPAVYAYGQDLSARKPFYAFCVHRFNLLTSMDETADYSASQLFSISIDYMRLFFARHKSVVDNACMYAYNVNGDMPYYRGKHQIKGKVYYTAFIDTRFSWTPNSPN